MGKINDPQVSLREGLLFLGIAAFVERDFILTIQSNPNWGL